MTAAGVTELPVSGIMRFVVVTVFGIAIASPVETTLPCAILKVKVVAVVGIFEVEIAVGMLKDEDVAAIIRLGLCGEKSEY